MVESVEKKVCCTESIPLNLAYTLSLMKKSIKDGIRLQYDVTYQQSFIQYLIMYNLLYNNIKINYNTKEELATCEGANGSVLLLYTGPQMPFVKQQV